MHPYHKPKYVSLYDSFGRLNLALFIMSIISVAAHYALKRHLASHRVVTSVTSLENAIFPPLDECLQTNDRIYLHGIVSGH